MMIQPILTYRSTVKLSHTSTQLKKLKSLERRASVIVGRGVPSITNCINKEACCLVKRSLQKTLCQNFNDYFVLKSHSKRTRNSGHLIKLPLMKLEIGKHSFSYTGAKIFNELSLHIKKIDSFTEFRNELMKYLNN